MKYLKIFEEYNLAFKIDTDIVMDTLSSLRDDDKYDIDIIIINYNGSTISYKESAQVVITINSLKKYSIDLINWIFDIIHQMLNNYYSETGNEICVSINNIDSLIWNDRLIFYISTIESYKDISKDAPYKSYLMRKDDITSYPTLVSDSQLESVNNSKKVNIDVDIVMDTLSSLKDDDRYDVDVSIQHVAPLNKKPYDIKEVKIRLSNSEWLRIINIDISNDYDLLMNLIYSTIHQMLNNYYNETGNEIYFVLFDKDPFSVSRAFTFYLYTDISVLKLLPSTLIIKKDDVKFPNTLSQLHLESVNYIESDFDDVKDVFQDIIDEYDLSTIPETCLLPYGLSYQFEFHRLLDQLSINIYVNDHFGHLDKNRDINRYRNIFSSNVFQDAINNFYNRVKSMGFGCVIDSDSKRRIKNGVSSTGPFIIDIFKRHLA